MADVERFNGYFAYLADKPELDVTEAMGFDPLESSFKLVTRESFPTSIRGHAETARVIGLVVSNVGVINDGIGEEVSTELYALNASLYDTGAQTLTENGLDAEVLAINRRREQVLFGTSFNQINVPKHSIDISRESAFMVIKQALNAAQDTNLKAQPDIKGQIDYTSPSDSDNVPHVDESTRPPQRTKEEEIISSVIAARNNQIKREQIEDAKKQEELDRQQAIDDKRKAEQEISDEYAKIFIRIATQNAAPKRALHSAVNDSYVGRGWVLRNFEKYWGSSEYQYDTKGIFLTDDMRTYYFQEPFYRKHLDMVTFGDGPHAPFLHSTGLLGEGLNRLGIVDDIIFDNTKTKQPPVQGDGPIERTPDMVTTDWLLDNARTIRVSKNEKIISARKKATNDAEEVKIYATKDAERIKLNIDNKNEAQRISNARAKTFIELMLKNQDIVPITNIYRTVQGDLSEKTKPIGAGWLIAPNLVLLQGGTVHLVVKSRSRSEATYPINKIYSVRYTIDLKHKIFAPFMSTDNLNLLSTYIADSGIPIPEVPNVLSLDFERSE